MALPSLSASPSSVGQFAQFVQCPWGLEINKDIPYTISNTGCNSSQQYHKKIEPYKLIVHSASKPSFLHISIFVNCLGKQMSCVVYPEGQKIQAES